MQFPQREECESDLTDQSDESDRIDHNLDATLFDRHAQSIFAYAGLHTLSREDAEDVTLDVFIAALEQDNLSAFPENERLAWLRRVAHNKLVDRYRRSHRRSVVNLTAMQEMLYEDERHSPEQVTLRQEEYQRLHNIIGALPDLQRQLLRLRYGYGLPFAEIATLLNKREDAIRKMLSRTLAFLRKHYTEEQGEDRS